MECWKPAIFHEFHMKLEFLRGATIQRTDAATVAVRSLITINWIHGTETALVESLPAIVHKGTNHDM